MMEIWTYTSRGNREENQDFAAWRQIGAEAGIFVVADGMGGYWRGDLAARVVADAIVESVCENWDAGDPRKILTDALEYANDMLSLVRIASEGKKMGAVVCALMIRDWKAYICWLGDSRVYHYSEGVRKYRTRDHSMVAELSRIRSLKACDIEGMRHREILSYSDKVADWFSRNGHSGSRSARIQSR